MLAPPSTIFKAVPTVVEFPVILSVEESPAVAISTVVFGVLVPTPSRPAILSQNKELEALKYLAVEEANCM